MDFDLPDDLVAYLAELDDFIEREIKPLEADDDNIRFFDHRREDARTDWDRGGLPNEEWEALLAEARRRADAAGHYRYPFPVAYGGRDGTNLGMAVIREHLAAKGLNCPTPLNGTDGEALRELCGRPAAICSFLEGMWPRRPNERHCQLLGAALADLHVKGRDFAMQRPNNLSLSGWQELAAKTAAPA